MFNLGVTEMIVIGILALVVLGPEKFPTFAKVALRAYRDLRGYIDDAKRDITKELNPLKKDLNELSRYRPEDIIDKLAGPEVKEIKSELNKTKSDIEKSTSEIDATLKQTAAETPQPEGTGANEAPPADRVPGTQPASTSTFRGDYTD